MRALALSMNGGWSILAEAFAHCPPGGHDPARGAPLPASVLSKFPSKKKGRFLFQILLETATFRRFVGYPFRALRDHNFKPPARDRNTYYPPPARGPGKVARPRRILLYRPRNQQEFIKLALSKSGNYRHFASIGTIEESKL